MRFILNKHSIGLKVFLAVFELLERQDIRGKEHKTQLKSWNGYVNIGSKLFNIFYLCTIEVLLANININNILVKICISIFYSLLK